MKRTILILVMTAALATTLIAGCNSAPEPTATPQKGGGIPSTAPNNNDSNANTPYPNPNNNRSNNTTAYPGPGNAANPADNPNGTGTTSPYPDPLQPIAGEENMKRGEVFIDEMGVISQENMPSQYVLHIVGNLPTPCHKLRAKVNSPDGQNQILVEAYSLVNPDEVCTQVLSPLDTNITLGSYPTGKYSVVLNGEKAGEFDAP